jgi:hypothetical protein
LEKENFEIGKIFYTGSGKWLCTDIGKRTINAIKVERENIKGPPFEEEEHVFTEFDFGGCFNSPRNNLPFNDKSYDNLLNDIEIYEKYISERNDKVLSEKWSYKNRKLYIVGMAKSSLNLKGGKLRNLELDYLRLIQASQNCKYPNKIIPYLLVWNEKIKKVIENKWNKKYKVGDGKIFIFTFDEKDSAVNKSILQEKENNKKGITENSKELSGASYSKETLENYLKNLIESRLKDINTYKKKEKSKKELIDINWDYFEVI